MPVVTRAMSTLYNSMSQRMMVTNLQTQLDGVQKEIATGIKADVYRDMGRRAVDTISLRMTMERNDGFLATNEILKGKLETGAQALNDIRAAAQTAMDLAIVAVDRPNEAARELKNTAAAALDRITARTSASINGAYSFSGIASDTAPLPKWSAEDPAFGRAPADLITARIGGLPTDAADARAKIAALRATFDSDPALPAADRFEGGIYKGAPANGERVSARISETDQLVHGVQANDPAFRDVLRGLAMLSAVEVSDIEDIDAYKTWMTEATTALSSGLEKLLAAETQTGLNQSRLEDVMATQEDRRALLNNQINAIEGVDPYEAASKLNLLQSQLQATYAVTARLNELSFLNYMR